MGKISEVFYQEIDRNPNETAEYYYHYNLLSSNNKMIDDEYEDYERSQILEKNRIIGNEFNSGKIPRHPNINSSMLGISPLKRKSIIIVEY